MSEDLPLVAVARVVAPFGRKGEVKALLETDYPEALAGRRELVVTDDQQQGKAMEVEAVRFHKGAALVKFRGVNSISEAEDLRGAFLAVRREERANLAPDNYWVSDIVGMEAEMEDGRPLGRVTEVLRGKAHDTWVTPKALIPAVKAFVSSVDMDRRRVIVRYVEGFEINES